MLESQGPPPPTQETTTPIPVASEQKNGFLSSLRSKVSRGKPAPVIGADKSTPDVTTGQSAVETKPLKVENPKSIKSTVRRIIGRGKPAPVHIDNGFGHTESINPDTGDIVIESTPPVVDNQPPSPVPPESTPKPEVSSSSKLIDRIHAELQKALDTDSQFDPNTPVTVDQESVKKQLTEEVSKNIPQQFDEMGKEINADQRKSQIESTVNGKLADAISNEEKRLKDVAIKNRQVLESLLKTDSRGKIHEPVLDAAGNPIMENGQPKTQVVDVSSDLTDALTKLGKPDLAAEWKEFTQNESVMDAATSIDEELGRNPNSKLAALRDKLTLLKGLYNKCEESDAEGRGVIAALMYQEISGINTGELTSNATSKQQIDAGLGKIRTNEKVFTSRLDTLVAKMAGEGYLPKDFDRKDILKTVVLANMIRAHPSSIIRNEQTGAYEMNEEMRQIMATNEWKLGPHNRQLIISLSQSGNIGELTNSLHLKDLPSISTNNGLRGIIESAVDDTIDRLGEPAENKDKRIKEKMEFMMKIFKDIKDKKEKSAFWGALGPLGLALLLSGQSLLEFGVTDMMGGQQRHP